VDSQPSHKAVLVIKCIDALLFWISLFIGDDSSGGHDFARVMEYLKKIGQHRKVK
jgi:hypothetical protein